MFRSFICAISACIFCYSCSYDGPTHDVSTLGNLGSESEIDSFMNCSSFHGDYNYCVTQFKNCVACRNYKVTNANSGLVYSVKIDSSGNYISQSGMPATYNTPKVGDTLCAQRPFKFNFVVFPIADSDYIIRDIQFEPMKGGSQFRINDTIPFVSSFNIQGVFGDEGVDKLHVRIGVTNSKTGLVFGNVSYIDQFHLSACNGLQDTVKP